MLSFIVIALIGNRLTLKMFTTTKYILLKTTTSDYFSSLLHVTSRHGTSRHVTARHGTARNNAMKCERRDTMEEERLSLLLQQLLCCRFYFRFISTETKKKEFPLIRHVLKHSVGSVSVPVRVRWHLYDRCYLHQSVWTSYPPVASWQPCCPCGLHGC